MTAGYSAAKLAPTTVEMTVAMKVGLKAENLVVLWAQSSAERKACKKAAESVA